MGWGGSDRLPCRAQAKLDWSRLRQYLPSDVLWGVLQDGKLNNIKVFVIIFSITSNYPYKSQLSEIMKKIQSETCKT